MQAAPFQDIRQNDSKRLFFISKAVFTRFLLFLPLTTIRFICSRQDLSFSI